MGFVEVAASFEVAVSDEGDFREDVAARPEEVIGAGVGLPTWLLTNLLDERRRVARGSVLDLASYAQACHVETAVVRAARV
jgi:hypothetical protein